MEREGAQPEPSPAGLERRFPCATCGAGVVFAPGTGSLVCPYCGAANAIPDEGAGVVELDFREHLGALAEVAGTVDRIVSHCDTCGADVAMPDDVTSHACPFCGSDVVATGRSAKLIKPGAVLPFAVGREAARSAYRAWILKRWFAPGKLRSESRIESSLAGIYLPFWTYDTDTLTDYTGQRGEHYYVTVPYTTTVNGRTVTRTRQERRTRWHPASGRVRNTFDDLLVCASRSLPIDLVDGAHPWDLSGLRPYADEYLAGFRAESYAVDLPAGFERAQALMQPEIDRSIRADIGGDEQAISTKSMRHLAITFKHVLLPVWVCAYRYKNKLYRVVVNAQTGEVVGDRPYSVWKILGASLGVAAACLVVLLVALALRGG